MDKTKGTILVVDDDLAVMNVIIRKMQAEGYNCVIATNGRDALDKASTQHIDLVLLDIKMPGLSGIEVLPQLITEHPDTSVVMVTAVDDTETAVEAMKLGAYDYVTKPFNMDDLAIRVEKALERKRLVEANRDLLRAFEQEAKPQRP